MNSIPKYKQPVRAILFLGNVRDWGNMIPSAQPPSMLWTDGTTRYNDPNLKYSSGKKEQQQKNSKSKKCLKNLELWGYTVAVWEKT